MYDDFAQDWTRNDLVFPTDKLTDELTSAKLVH